MKKGFYYWMFLIGGVLSALMLLDLLCIPNWVSILCSFFAMLGGGVLCSAFVSFLIEKQNNVREKKLKESQRDYLLKSVRSNFSRLCERELAELSYYYSNYVLGRKDKVITEKVPIREVGRRICELLTKIEELEEQERNATKEIVITLEKIDMENIKRKHLVSNNMIYYDYLLRALTSISTDSVWLYSSGVFCDTDVEGIEYLSMEIQDVIRFSGDFDLYDGTTLVMKKCLFERIHDILALINMSSECIMDCRFKPYD